MKLSNECTDDCGLGYYLVFEDPVTDFDARNESTGIDVEIPGFPGPIEGNDDFFERNPKGT